MSSSLVRPIDPLLLLDRQRVPRPQVVQVLLHDDVAAAGERRVLGADQRPPRRPPGPAGFSVPSTKPSRSRTSKYLKPCTSSTDRHRAAEPVHDLRRQLEAQVQPPGPDVEQQVAGCRDRVVPAPASSRNGCSSAGRGPPNSRSQASRPDRRRRRQAAVGVAETDRPLQPGRSAASSSRATAFSRRARRSPPGRSRPGSAGEHGLRFGHQHSFVIRLVPHPATSAVPGTADPVSGRSGSRPPARSPVRDPVRGQVNAFSPAADNRYAGAIDAASARTRSTTAEPAASGVSGSPSCRR